MWAFDHCGVAPLKQDEETFTNLKDKAEYFTNILHQYLHLKIYQLFLSWTITHLVSLL